jgi:cytochrome c-type biogenesis protein CcmE
MHPTRKKKLYWLIVLVAGVGIATGLVLYALRQNLNHFYTPSELATQIQKEAESIEGRTIRVGGLVTPGSVKRDDKTLNVSFHLTDQHNGSLEIRYQGILPDLFREGQGIIAIGKLEAIETLESTDKPSQSTRYLTATEVLAKHDENYMPPELKHLQDTL